MADAPRTVVVVGAGPAGTAAAIELARAGHEVVVVDKARFPRDKICGDGLTTGALRRLEALGVAPSEVTTWQPVEDAWIRSPSGFEVRMPLPRGLGTFAAIVPRVELDDALVRAARKEGATVHEGHALIDVGQDSTGVTVEVEGLGPIRARFCVAADGMWSPTRKALGATVAGYRGDWHAFRQYVGGVTGRAATDLFTSFEADLLPGYFWSFPLPDGRANIGFGIERGGKHPIREMGRLWEDLLQRPHLRELLGPDVTPLGPHRAWPIPAHVGLLSPWVGRTLFVGDAVAACDVMTGEGIGQALQTGMLAAEAIDRWWATPDRVGAGYGEQLAAELGPDHRMAALLVRALRHRKGARSAIRVAAANDWTRRNFARWLFEDSPRGIAFTPRRWRRGALSGVGAYRD